jgi:hypothetical protein
MPKFEQAPDISAKDQERKDLIQTIAESKYAKLNQEEGDETVAEKLGPPNPENYKEAEEALNELFDGIQRERYDLDIFSSKLAAVLGGAPITLGVIMSAIASSMRSPAGWTAVGQEKRSFLESLRKEWNESPIPNAWTPEYSAAGELKKLKKDSQKLEDVRSRTDSEASK